MNDTVIRIEHLTKRFGNTVAVDDLNLDIRRGELFGLVGPDGAGKTTTMRLLTGIMLPTSGDAWVASFSIGHEAERIKEEIGYMSQRFGLYEDLTVMENIIFYADLYDVPKAERPSGIEKLLGFSNLTPFTGRRAGDLSGGMKQKLGLACALIHKPAVLFLDEPTNGVDPVSRRDFWKILYGLLKDGSTIVISTSYLDEAERCTRVGLMNNGRLLTVDEPQRIRRSIRLPVIEMWPDNTREAARIIRDIAGVQDIGVYGDRIHATLDDTSRLKDITDTLSKNGITITDGREILPSLEDVFIAMIERGAPEV